MHCFVFIYFSVLFTWVGRYSVVCELIVAGKDLLYINWCSVVVCELPIIKHLNKAFGALVQRTNNIVMTFIFNSNLNTLHW